ncbi:hypothetical protein LK994_14340 [Ferruginibacter lapsinanis]|uniref:hypothetical protein n=1 Tax=Ferruginibacter lapsinanis TaxID=563172 RepID=UPI001E6464B1|nr:hypothetical protein [Ferruginibacter lapsinanis]UEG49817.1 hypothetical protein LK994_14340 [Ferruginibacter lapsinanis]
MRQIYLDNAEDDCEIEKLSFYSPSEGYVAFTYFIGYTIDSGRTFTKKFITLSNVDFNGYSVNLTFGFGIEGVKAFNKNALIVYGHYGFIPAILYSTDGGSTFKLVYQSQFSDNFSWIKDMIFPENNSIGYAIDDDRIFKTINGGLTWNVIAIQPRSFFNYLEAVDNNNVIAIAKEYGYTKMIKTSTGGSSWQNVTLPALQDIGISYGYFLTPNTGWINVFDHDNNEYIYKTTNGGLSWVAQNDPTVSSYLFEKMKFINDSVGYAIGGAFTIYKTIDNGKIWEPLPRNNQFTYLGYSHNDFQFISNNQFWAAGGHDFIELNTNASITLPKAYFKVERNGCTVNLINHSRNVYSYKWFVNNTQISTAYNTSYTHVYNKQADTIKLVVSNGIYTDTLTNYQYYNYPTLITGFSPSIGTIGTVLTISGSNLASFTSVNIGGIPASSASYSNDNIFATVENGASGNITVTSFPNCSSSTLNGFTYYPPLHIDLPVSFNDTTLCKNQKLVVTIQNTELNVRYELLDVIGNSYGYANGNGNTISFNVSNITSPEGDYRIMATGISSNLSMFFTNSFHISIEDYPKSDFTFNKVNIFPGERVDFKSRAVNAAQFDWLFYESTTTVSSTDKNPTNIKYVNPGQTLVKLVSISKNGCRDTLSKAGPYVINNNTNEDKCYINNIPDQDLYTTQKNSEKILSDFDDGYFLTGQGYAPQLKSRYGISKNISPNSGNSIYLAKYAKNGILNWYIYFPKSGSFNDIQKDNSGNTFIVGEANKDAFLILSNGDTVLVAAPPTSAASAYNGFIIKLDSSGNYLWHTVMYNTVARPNSSYPIKGAIPDKLKIRNNAIYVTGYFSTNISYCKNASIANIISLTDPGGSTEITNNFISKIDTEGSVVWNTYIENTGPNANIGIDNLNNLYLAGNYKGIVKIHDIVNTYQLPISDSSYLLKFNASGTSIWKKTYQKLIIKDVAVDETGNSFITGALAKPVTLTGGIIANRSNFFLTRTDLGGTENWTVSADSAINSYSEGKSIVINNDEVHLLGAVNNYNTTPILPLQFTPNDNSTTVSKSSLFVTIYSTSGTYKSTYISDPIMYGNALGNLLFDNYRYTLLFTGRFNTSATIVNEPFSTNGNDVSVMKYRPYDCVMSTFADAGPDQKKCPAPDPVALGAWSFSAYNIYSWTSFPAGFSSTSARPLVTPTVNTDYYLKATNILGQTTYDTVKITVSPAPEISLHSWDTILCISSEMIVDREFGVNTCNPANSYQWQSNSGNGYVDLQDDSVTNTYFGTKEQYLRIFYLPPIPTGTQFRCVVDGNLISNSFTISFKTQWINNTAYSNNWESPDNWSCGVVPDANTDVYLENCDILITSPNAICRSLQLTPTAKITIAPGAKLTITH